MGVAGKEQGDFFSGGLQFLDKKKLKSEIFMTKEAYKQKFFCVCFFLCHN